MAQLEDFIPGNDDDFFSFQKNLRERLHRKEDEDGEPAPGEAENFEKWSIPEDDVKDLDDMGKDYEKKYHKAQNKTNRTSGDVTAHREAREGTDLIEGYEKFMREFIGQWIRKNKKISNAQRKLMALTVPDTEPSPHPQIVDPIVGLTPIPGGDLEVRVRSTEDQTRPSKPLPHILVQVQYALVNLTDPAPAFEQAILQHQSSKALFIIHFGISNVGKRFYGYFRWYDPIHPEDSGPWTQPHTAVLS